MSTAVMPTQLDIGETAYQSRRGLYSMDQQWQMCSTTTTTFLMSSRQRNLSGPVTGSTSATLDNRALATPPPGVPGSRDSRREDFSSSTTSSHNANHRKDGSRNSSHHRKLDRSLSDSEDRINGNNGGGNGSGRGVNSSRYKTELCRPFEESGHCKYGDKCQFAHGAHELRNLSRHPKYKTELCRTYHSVGFCPYGPRCHFIHNEDEHKMSLRKHSSNNGSSSPRMSSSSSSGHPRQCQMILSPSSSSSSSGPSSSSSYSQHRPSNLCGLNSLGSSFESVSSSSSPGNLSPSHLEDTFPPIGTFSPSAVSIEESATPIRGGADNSSEVGTIFNFPASDTSSMASVLTPLNIQTQQMYNNVLDAATLARFSAVLNMNQNQHNNQQTSSYNQQQQQPNNLNARQQPQPAAAENCCWASMGHHQHHREGAPESGLAFPPPCGSPHSDDSMGSNGSLELISSAASPPQDSSNASTNLVNSPHDLGRAMRLPIFNKLAVEREQ